GSATTNSLVRDKFETFNLAMGTDGFVEKLREVMIRRLKNKMPEFTPSTSTASRTGDSSHIPTIPQAFDLGPHLVRPDRTTCVDTCVQTMCCCFLPKARRQPSCVRWRCKNVAYATILGLMVVAFVLAGVLTGQSLQ